MKTAEEIRAEIAELDKAIDERIAEYKRGTLPDDVFHEVRTRLTSAKNTLLWVLKSEAAPKADDVEVWTEYSESADMTFIMEGRSDGKTSSISVVGFYFGEPTDKDTEFFRGKTTATCEL